MSPSGKKKTTFAKLNREARLRERRSEKAARKEARRNGTAEPRYAELQLATEDALSDESSPVDDPSPVDDATAPTQPANPGE
jgi:hypothetical protein